ncbi:hypothetical protein [Streptomyces umbrinus]|uniref:hypothetical protein n=1 Tax=Streptomyces umbrinus TaxID=67370 RepID=UPI003C2EA4FD
MGGANHLLAVQGPADEKRRERSELGDSRPGTGRLRHPQPAPHVLGDRTARLTAVDHLKRDLGWIEFEPAVRLAPPEVEVLRVTVRDYGVQDNGVERDGVRARAGDGVRRGEVHGLGDCLPCADETVRRRIRLAALHIAAVVGDAGPVAADLEVLEDLGSLQGGVPDEQTDVLGTDVGDLEREQDRVTEAVSGLAAEGYAEVLLHVGFSSREGGCGGSPRESDMGVAWLSPGCLWGARRALTKRLRKHTGAAMRYPVCPKACPHRQLGHAL